MKPRRYNAAVGQRVRERRLALGLTLDDVADQLGLNKSNIFRYETGESGIDVETLAAFGRCLKCPPEKFLEGIGEKATR